MTQSRDCEPWRYLAVLLFAAAVVVGGAVPVQLEGKIDRAYCGSGAHADPCPGKYSSPWIFCGDPLAGPECMTATDAAAFYLGLGVAFAGAIGAIFAWPFKEIKEDLAKELADARARVADLERRLRQEGRGL